MDTPEPPAAGRTALLVVDMQNDFVLTGSPVCVAGAAATVPSIRALLGRWRAAAAPVVHVTRAYAADGSDVEAVRLEAFRRRPFLVPGTPGVEVVDGLEPADGEHRVVKTRYSAFFATPLDLLLRRLRVERVVLTGTQYPACIRSTAFDALSLGYEVAVANDACSAATPAVAEANVFDLRNVGVACLDGAALAAEPWCP